MKLKGYFASIGDDKKECIVSHTKEDEKLAENIMRKKEGLN